ncbi:MAG TPA: DNA-processing protein DprA [Solirubrobacteraceae bacterium]|nr:DNA-processing protein DprA [Solirubrobacteraceae bacterium]
MSFADRRPAAHAACTNCLRRSWLLAQLSGPLDFICSSPERLVDLLALPDEKLIEALAGRRRSELHSRHAHFSPSELTPAVGVVEICRHDGRYPPTLRGALAPAMLFASGDLSRLSRLTTHPMVAIVGARKPTDYGIEMAGALARGLAASGVTVVGELADGITQAGQDGALQTGAALAVLPSGVDVAPPARQRSLLARMQRVGVAVSELPCGSPRRRWSTAAAVRIVAALAPLTVIVEAEDSEHELAGAHIAHTLGRTVAAVPGRVTSRASSGAHVLLREGASLVRGAGDVLDLLCVTGRPAERGDGELDGLEPRLRAVLDSVAAGLDTPHKLIGGGEPGELLQALSELEVLGLLARGDGGRYVPSGALGGAA